MPDRHQDIDPQERFSTTLCRLLDASDGNSMTIREMVGIMQGKGLQMVIVLLCLPFLGPVTIPGISIPFGLAIALSGLRLAFGHKPWLPAIILDRRVSHHALEKMVKFGCGVYKKMEKVIRPRWSFMFESPAMNILVGLAIALSGILLSLPIPPPFMLTNTIPGFAIIFLTLGMMERDGRMILWGYIATLIATIYVGLIGLLGTAGLNQLWKFFSGDPGA